MTKGDGDDGGMVDDREWGGWRWGTWGKMVAVEGSRGWRNWKLSPLTLAGVACHFCNTGALFLTQQRRPLLGLSCETARCSLGW